MASVDIDYNDILMRLTDSCPAKKKPFDFDHECEKCVHGYVLNDAGKMLARMIKKVPESDKSHVFIGDI